MRMLNTRDDETVSLILKKGFDPFLIERIQPRGNISFKDPEYVRTGTGYEACLHIYDFPGSLDIHWLSKVCNINGVITAIDTATDDATEVKKNLNKSMKEQKSRLWNTNEDSDAMDANQRYKELKLAYEDVANLGEIMKLVKIRVFVAAPTLEALEERIGEVQTTLHSDDFDCAVYLNENQPEWESIYESYKKQDELHPQNARYGQPLVSASLAAGNPFHFSSLNDAFGQYFGSTPCGGTVNFYIFTKTKKRTSYNALVLGSMGSGKSTILKKIAESCFMRNDFVRTFDPSGEWHFMTLQLGGKSINLDGSDGIINIFDILRTDESESLSYVRHISKLSVIYQMLSGSTDNQESITFENTVRDMYVETGVFPADGDLSKTRVTGLSPEKYFTCSDYVAFLEKKIATYSINKNSIRAELDKLELIRLDKIRKNFDQIIKNYSYILDGHTSIPNIMDVQFVCFVIKNVLNLKSNICDVILFNALSMCWDNCTRNGLIMKNLYEEGKIREEDIVHFLVEFDELHKLINAHKTTAIKQLTDMQREMRKYFGSLVLATQSVREMVPKGSEGGDGAKLINDLFDLSIYKFIGRQDANTMTELTHAFSGSLTKSELDRIPKLEQGQFILCMSGDMNLEFHVYADEEELNLFRGGA